MAGLENTTGHITHLMESIWSAVTGASRQTELSLLPVNKMTLELTMKAEFGLD